MSKHLSLISNCVKIFGFVNLKCLITYPVPNSIDVFLHTEGRGGGWKRGESEFVIHLYICICRRRNMWGGRLVWTFSDWSSDSVAWHLSPCAQFVFPIITLNLQTATLSRRLMTSLTFNSQLLVQPVLCRDAKFSITIWVILAPKCDKSGTF